MTIKKCEDDRPGLELRCHGGYLWELTYNECAPPGQRQNTGMLCKKCNGSMFSDGGIIDYKDDVEDCPECGSPLEDK